MSVGGASEAAQQRDRPCRVAVSGTSGFVGRVLAAELTRRGFDVVRISRADIEAMRSGSIDTAGLAGCACAIHLAARAHVLRETDTDPMAAFRHVNRDLTVAFAQACASAGVRRFVFVSSIGVNGSSSCRPFRADDPPAPDEPYAVSKLEAERGIWEIARTGGLDVVVVRPPLVYGPDAKGNFRRLMKLASMPVPLPFGRISARRTLISVWNLADLLIRCIEHPDAAGRVFLAGDAEDVSLPELLTYLRSAMGRRPALLPVPESLMRLATGVIGRRHVYEKLTASLQVATDETFRVLEWKPPLSLREGLSATVRMDAEHRAAVKPQSSGRRHASDAAKRLFDTGVALIALVVLAVPMLLIGAIVAATSRGPILYWSDRIGRNNTVFRMPKFRSMYVGTPPVATHLLTNPAAHITPVGQFLRKSSLDELPQLWSVLTGDMSLVGPRPALFNQYDLIEARTAAGVHVLRPGITGWAQVNGRDELPIPAKVAFDAQYLAARSLLFDARILLLTGLRVLRRDGVSH